MDSFKKEHLGSCHGVIKNFADHQKEREQDHDEVANNEEIMNVKEFNKSFYAVSNNYGPLLVEVNFSSNSMYMNFFIKIAFQGKRNVKIFLNRRKIYYYLNEWNSSDESGDSLSWIQGESALLLKSMISRKTIQPNWNRFVDRITSQKMKVLIKFAHQLTLSEIDKLPAVNQSLKNNASSIVNFLKFFKSNFAPSRRKEVENTSFYSETAEKQFSLFKSQCSREKKSQLKEVQQHLKYTLNKTIQQNNVLGRIKILQTFPSSDVQSSDFSYLRPFIGRGYYKVQIFYEFNSIGKQTNELIASKVNMMESEIHQKQKKRSEIKTMNLVTKQFSLGNEFQFMNELYVIKHLRQQRCCRIASYFVEEICKDAEVERIFIEEYPYKISRKMNFFQTINSLYELLESLSFLHSASIIHRDLKPGNILISTSNSLKLIDFGSSLFTKDAPFKVPENKMHRELRTTLHYNIFYSSLPGDLKEKLTQEQFEEHPNFDVYSFGILIQELCINSRFEAEAGTFAYENIQYVSERCKELNPKERLTIPQLLLLLNKIRCYMRIIHYGTRI